MSLNMLSFTAPILNFVQTQLHLSPKSYSELDNQPPSKHADQITAVVSNILTQQNVEGALYYERVQDLLSGLPEGAPKTIDSLIEHRFKAVKPLTDSFISQSTGTDVGSGKYFIAIASEIDTQAIPYLASHEMSSILGEHDLNSAIIKTVTTFASAVLCTTLLNSGLAASLAITAAAHLVTDFACTKLFDQSSDLFALQHCSEEELHDAVSFLEEIKSKREEGIYSNNPLLKILYPSEDSKVQRIQDYINSSVEELVEEEVSDTTNVA